MIWNTGVWSDTAEGDVGTERVSAEGTRLMIWNTGVWSDTAEGDVGTERVSAEAR